MKFLRWLRDLIPISRKERAVRALIFAYCVQEETGTVEWEDLDRAFELAKEATSWRVSERED